MTSSDIIDDSEIIKDEVKNKRPRLILFLLFIIIAFSILSVISDSWMDNRTIKKVKVFGASLESPDNIAKLIRDSVMNKRLMDINTSEISKIVNTNSFVANSRVNALFNGEFQVFITERVPICLAIDSEGEIRYCDSRGYTFEYIPLSQYENLPVLRGVPGTDDFRSTARILNRILLESSEYTEIISEIMPGRGKSTYQIITSDYSYKLILDGNDDLSEQLSKYYVFLGSGLCANDLVKIDYIDLRWEKRLVIGKLS